jgi:lysyl-tRNA synthetase class II
VSWCGIIGISEKLLGKLDFEYQGKSISLQRPWRRATMHELVKEVRHNLKSVQLQRRGPKWRG